MNALLVALDDTDDAESIGTGRLARLLADELVGRGLGASATVTRHQLLVHPDIPYTSHNSAACIRLEGAGDAAAVAETSRAFLGAHRHEGANPGLCVLAADAVPGAVVALARRAQREVLRLDAFDRAAAAAGVDSALWSSGETGQGRIGALCGAALRATGEDGRFIALPGIRELGGVLPVSAILARSPVERVVDEAGAALPGDASVHTGDWVRPSLRGGVPVLAVRRHEGGWVPAERRPEDAAERREL